MKCVIAQKEKADQEIFCVVEFINDELLGKSFCEGNLDWCYKYCQENKNKLKLEFPYGIRAIHHYWWFVENKKVKSS